MIEKITSGDCVIVDSGYAYSFDGDSDIRFEMNLKEEGYSCSFTFSFAQSEKGEPSFKGSANGNNFSFMCLNFDDPLGTGIGKPIVFATNNKTNSELLLSFWVFAYGNKSTRKVEFTIFKKSINSERETL